MRKRAGLQLLMGSMVVLAALNPPSAASARRDVEPYNDRSLPVPARIEDLLARMSLEEKVAQLVCVGEIKPRVLDAQLELDPEKLTRLHPNGLGQYARPSDARGGGSPRVFPGRDPRRTVAHTNAIQRWSLTKTRLGIPVLFHEEGLHGYMAVGATSFPQAIALASSWDPDLLRAVNSVTAREIRARGVHMVLSPVVDVARDPRWGRIEETFGEDPHLVSELGVAAVEGLQGARGSGDTLSADKVFATLKHLTGHGQPESGTNVGPAPVSERELRSVFFPPFEEILRRTDIRAVMASYNEIDGIPSHGNGWLLNAVLRQEWGFQGAVVSDYAGIDQLISVHHVAKDVREAALRALHAGVDADLPDGASYGTLVNAVRSGVVSEEVIDRAVRRMLGIKFHAGLFEQPYADAAAAERATNTSEARALALRAAERSVILLKNDGMLPLDVNALKSLAVIGPNAAVARLGGYYGQPPHSVSILEGIRSRVGQRIDVRYAEGVQITQNDDWWADEVKLADAAENRKRIATAVDVARDADAIILVIGDTEQTSREAWAAYHLGDRSSLDLVGEQQELADALLSLGKPVAVVLINGRPLAVNVVAAKANALVEGWYLGEQGGAAMARILFGDVNPGGKLPVTIPQSVGQLPMFYNSKPSARRGYLFGTVEPLFPFGFGLSYTQFEMSAPRLSATRIGLQGSVQVSVDVRNTGSRAGDETVQVYVRDDVSSVTRPIKELKAFRRITLAPGEQRTVTFALDSHAFRMWNADMKRAVEPGTFTIMAGPSSSSLKSASLVLEGA